jgi:hypothetical protein
MKSVEVSVQNYCTCILTLTHVMSELLKDIACNGGMFFLNKSWRYNCFIQL